MGIYSALRQFTFWDTTLTTAALIIWGIPVFVLGLFMQWLFGYKLDLLPLIGAGDNVFWVIPASWTSFVVAHPAGRHAGPDRGRLHLVHAACLHARGHPRRLHPHGAGQGPLRARAWSRKHAFKNAVIPVMTIAGIDLGALMGGAILTETVFNRPGIGLMIYQAIGARDLPVVAGGVLFATIVYVFANLFVDLGYAWVDPRIRLEG